MLANCARRRGRARRGGRQGPVRTHLRGRCSAGRRARRVHAGDRRARRVGAGRAGRRLRHRVQPHRAGRRRLPVRVQPAADRRRATDRARHASTTATAWCWRPAGRRRSRRSTPPIGRRGWTGRRRARLPMRAAIRWAACCSACSATGNDQTNWAARNASYVERDSDATLKGFDDRQRVVDVVNPRTGARERTIKRDYGELLPLVRHGFASGRARGARTADAAARRSHRRSTPACRCASPAALRTGIERGRPHARRGGRARRGDAARCWPR